MSAARLREAAAVLRGQVEKLTTDKARWDEAFPVIGVYADGFTYERLFVHPGVGLALADWLEDLADHNASDLMPAERGAFIVADLILGIQRA